jgi:hypothetical protein
MNISFNLIPDFISPSNKSVWKLGYFCNLYGSLEKDLILIK